MAQLPVQEHPKERILPLRKRKADNTRSIVTHAPQDAAIDDSDGMDDFDDANVRVEWIGSPVHKTTV